MSPLIILSILLPVVIRNVVNSADTRLGILIASTSVFLTALTLFTRGNLVELAVAGAT